MAQTRGAGLNPKSLTERPPEKASIKSKGSVFRQRRQGLIRLRALVNGNYLSSREGPLRAQVGATAIVRTPVRIEAMPVGPLSAQSCGPTNSAILPRDSCGSGGAFLPEDRLGNSLAAFPPFASLSSTTSKRLSCGFPCGPC
jgi:hypothetical protein